MLKSGMATARPLLLRCARLGACWHDGQRQRLLLPAIVSEQQGSKAAAKVQ
jgi:hypothetical protein